MIISIPIPVIGFINAGKTTLLGTILGGTYSPSSAKPCTQAAFKFIAHEKNHSLPDDGSDFKTLQDIRGIIQDMNEKHVETQDGTLSEMSFDVRVRTPLVAKYVHQCVQLEIIDIPGWDPDSKITGSCIAEYLESHWSSFGCIIVVLDVRSTTSKKQKELLTFLMEVNKDKGVPILIVGNKVDSIYDDGIPEAISEIEENLNNVFGDQLYKPSFAPVSAKQALFYSCAQGLETSAFLRDYAGTVATVPEKKNLDQIGHTVFSSNWKTIKPEERESKLFNKLKDDYDSAMGPDESNFRQVLAWIDATVGGDKQPPILKRILSLELKNITLESDRWVEKLHSISERLLKAKVTDQTDVADHLFGILRVSRAYGLAVFQSDMEWSLLTKTLNDLQTAAQKLHLEESEFNNVTNFRKEIVDRFFMTVIEEFNRFHKRENEMQLKSSEDGHLQGQPYHYDLTNERSKGKSERMRKIIYDTNGSASEVSYTASKRRCCHNSDNTNWHDLSALDWREILRSFLCIPELNSIFPKDHRFVRSMLDEFGHSWGLSKDTQVLRLFDPKTRDFIPTNKAPLMKNKVTIVCDHPRNPEHWGHIVWLCIEDAKRSY